MDRQLLLSLSLCHLVCITQPFLWSCLEAGVSLDVKNVMIHSPVDSFSAVIFPSVKRESGVKDAFSEPDQFYENDCHSGCCWTGCSQRVDPQFTQLLNSLLLSSVCVYVCVLYGQIHLYTHPCVNVCMLAQVVLCI